MLTISFWGSQFRRQRDWSDWNRIGLRARDWKCRRRCRYCTCDWDRICLWYYRKLVTKKANIVRQVWLPDDVGLSGRGTSAGRPCAVVVTINGIWVPGGSVAIDPKAAPAGGFNQIGTLEFAGGGVIGAALGVGLICNMMTVNNDCTKILWDTHIEGFNCIPIKGRRLPRWLLSFIWSGITCCLRADVLNRFAHLRGTTLSLSLHLCRPRLLLAKYFSLDLLGTGSKPKRDYWVMQMTANATKAINSNLCSL